MFRAFTDTVGLAADTAEFIAVFATRKVLAAPETHAILNSDAAKNLVRAADMAVGAGLIGMSFVMHPGHTALEVFDQIEKSSGLGEHLARGFEGMVDGVDAATKGLRLIGNATKEVGAMIKEDPAILGTTVAFVAVGIPFITILAALDLSTEESVLD